MDTVVTRSDGSYKMKQGGYYGRLGLVPQSFIYQSSFLLLFIIYSIEQGYHIGIMMNNMKNRPRATTKDLLPSSRYFVIATRVVSDQNGIK